MSAVETIRDIPVIVQHRKSCNADFDPMMVDDHDYSGSGFPFDNSRRSRDPLEDIAQRHPELAQHLQGFPRRSQRGGDQDDDEFLRRRFERPFSGGRFERFGFPFDRDDFEREPQRYYEAYPEYFENFQNQQPQSPSQQQPQQQQQSSSQTPQNFQPHSPQYSQQYQPQYSQQYQEPYNQQYQPQYTQQSQESQPSQQEPQYHSQVSQGTQTECEAVPETEGDEQEQKGDSGQIRVRPIQQSNTCDLGQSSPDEAVNDRNQRSMSLPPENKRYTSSVNIPMGGHQGHENGAKPQSQSGSSGSTERVIPIHVEGRDDPVMPKNFTGTTTSHPHPQPQPERIFTDAPRSQPERIFGQRPEHFTQFVNRDPHRFPSDWHHSFDRDFPEEDFGFARAGSPSRFGGVKQPHQQAHEAPQYQQQFTRQEATPRGFAPPQGPPKPQPQEQKPAQNEAPPQPKPEPQPQPPKQPLGPIEQIQAIQKDVSSLIRQVEVFNGMPKDKNYLYLDEMLTRNLLKLDNVDTQGQDSIRQARKEAIKCIEKTIGFLETKAAANAAGNGQKMEVEQPQSSQENEKMETESAQASQEPSIMEISPASSQLPEGEKDAVPTSDEANKSSETTQQSKSGENVESGQEQAKTDEKQSQPEVKSEETKEEAQKNNDVESKNNEIKQEAEVQTEKSEEVKKSDAPKEEVKSEGGEVKEEKKEKKKIKKKVNKEDKEKKQ